MYRQSKWLKKFSRHKIRRIAYIALFWTGLDVAIKLFELDFDKHKAGTSLIVREVLVFLMSIVLSYIFIYAFRFKFRQKSLLINFFLKTAIILFSALFMNFMVHLLENIVGFRMNFDNALNTFYADAMDKQWLLKKTFYWIALLLITQLYLEINDKYSPGVFLDILRGKYVDPKIEKKVVMFMDLKDSTPIAEMLGHYRYFSFIRDFIHYASLGIIEKQGTIYQYVGDEIVVSWPCSIKGARHSLDCILLGRKNIQRKSQYFKEKYNVVPEFRVGLHVGEVTIGEIGVIKKDLAMSGDTMNTTARIRSACNELNEKFLVSKEFKDFSNLKDFQLKPMGNIELKGKASSLELYALIV